MVAKVILLSCLFLVIVLFTVCSAERPERR